MDINELIAEKVMGWHKRLFNDRMCWLDANGVFQAYAAFYSDVLSDPFSPEDSISDAWRVVDKMWEIFPGLVITRWFSGEGAPYLVSLGNRNHGKEMGSAEETSITHAICFAALRAVGVEEEILKRWSELPQRSL